MKNRRSLVLFVLFFIILLLTFYRSVLILDSFFWSMEYDALQSKINEEKRVKLLLKEELLEVSSLRYLEEQARRKGFTEGDHYLFF